MKFIKADLLSDIVGSYDQTKTTTQGRVFTKTVGGATALGPAINTYVDTVADTAGTTIPVLSFLSPNGRLFSIGAEVTGLLYLSLHTINMSTGAKTFVGQIRMAVGDTAATTHTLRGFKVLDTGTTNWKIFLATTGTVAINGGIYMVNKVDLADFISVGYTLFPSATDNDQKATYFLQDPANIGAGQLNIASAGMVMDSTNNIMYCHNGIAATHQYYAYSMNTPPTYTTASVSVSVASPGVVSDAGHAFIANDPVVFTAGTLPTGLTVGTIYFVRNPVAGVSYELASTTGGASINTTGSPSVSASIGRAWGTTGSCFLYKTGNLPALTGTLIILDSEDYAVPAHTANSGSACAFFCTTTNLYLGKLSELTSGVTTWPSLVTSNALGSSNQIITPTITQATWSNILDRAVYLTNTNVLVMKQVVNNVIDKIFGRISNTYRETYPQSDTQGLGWITISSLDIEDGWIVVTPNATGQRGNLVCDLRSDSFFDYSYVVTKVLDTPSSVYQYLNFLRQISQDTGDITAYYRTSGFGSISGGWVSINTLADITATSPGNQVQFKLLFNTLGKTASIHAQLTELILGLDSLQDISDNWEFSDDFSDNTTPSRSAFRLKKVYTSSIPTLNYRAYDLSNVLLVNHDTVTDIAKFEYSTTNGVSWLPMGTIPNIVGTLVRYSFTSPPGVDIRVSLKES